MGSASKRQRKYIQQNNSGKFHQSQERDAHPSRGSLYYNK
jgi:hypothetical protein